MFLRQFARRNVSGEWSLADFWSGLSAGLAAVQRQGQTAWGHLALVDVISPAVDELVVQLAVRSDPGTALTTTADAAVLGAQPLLSGTVDSQGSGRTVVDPGAAVVAIMLQAAASAQTGRPVDTDWLSE